eukprot:m51a1_g4359 hypothetical protein (676) ;mRNA; f:258348-260802
MAESSEGPALTLPSIGASSVVTGGHPAPAPHGRGRGGSRRASVGAAASPHSVLNGTAPPVAATSAPTDGEQGPQPSGGPDLESSLFLSHAKTFLPAGEVEGSAGAGAQAAGNGAGGALGMPVLTSDVQRLCVDLLTRGDVRSFQDFFLLTHDVSPESARSPPVLNGTAPPVAATSAPTDGEQGSQPSGGPDLESSLFLSHAKTFLPAGEVEGSAGAGAQAAGNGAGGALGMPVLTSDVQRLCVDLLTRGDVRSFQDFFLLTHDVSPESARSPPSSPRAGTAPGQQAVPSLFRPREKPESIEVLNFLKEHLSEAETAQRLGDSKSVVGAFSMLAEHYERRGDATSLRVAVHFHTKCLDVAQRLQDKTLEGTVNRSLGACYQRVGDVERAIEHYEKFAELAKDSGKDVANKHLVSAYQSFAEDCAAADDWQRAVTYYLKVVEKAKDSGDTASQGSAHFRLGHCYKQLGDAESSIRHLVENLEICKAAGDEVGEAAACSALASAHQGANDRDKSIGYLLENFALAQRTKQLDAQGKACCNLGILYNKSGEHEQAAQYFEQYYAIAKQVGDPRMLDSARVYLGVARGNLRLRQFSHEAASAPDPVAAVRALFAQPVPASTPVQTSQGGGAAIGTATPFLSALTLQPSGAAGAASAASGAAAQAEADSGQASGGAGRAAV